MKCCLRLTKQTKCASLTKKTLQSTNVKPAYTIRQIGYSAYLPTSTFELQIEAKPFTYSNPMLISLLFAAFLGTFSFAQPDHNNILHSCDQDGEPPVSVVMKYSSEKNGKPVDKEGGIFILTLNGSKASISVEVNGSTNLVIWDEQESKMTTVVTDNKGKQMAMIMPRINLGRKNIDEYVGDIQRTDETKQLLGYDTRKYILTSKDGVTEAWLANIPGVSWAELAKAITGSDGKGTKKDFMPVIAEMPDAIALASKTTSRNGKEVSYMEVMEISTGNDVDLSRLEIPSGAEVQDLSSMMKF